MVLFEEPRDVGDADGAVLLPELVDDLKSLHERRRLVIKVPEALDPIMARLDGAASVQLAELREPEPGWTDQPAPRSAATNTTTPVT